MIIKFIKTFTSIKKQNQKRNRKYYVIAPYIVLILYAFMVYGCYKNVDYEYKVVYVINVSLLCTY